MARPRDKAGLASGGQRIFYCSVPLNTLQPDLHVLTVRRYVERNTLRAGLVERAEMWR